MKSTAEIFSIGEVLLGEIPMEFSLEGENILRVSTG
jgi:hypothetical protein